MVTQEEEVPPEVFGFRIRPRVKVRDQVVLTPGAKSINRSARGGVALLLPELARQKHPPNLGLTP